MAEIFTIPTFKREIITGSKEEHIVVNELRSIFWELGVDEVRLLPVNVLNWSELECRIEYDNVNIRCFALPYTLSSDIECSIVVANYVDDRIVVNEPIEESIVIIPFPDDPDDAKYVLLKLALHGARAVIFYDKLPGRYRRIVVTGVLGFPLDYGAPPPIPAVSITKEDYLKLGKIRPKKLRLYVKTNVLHNSVGYNVEAVINSRSDEMIYITAHHDHWFTGFSDNLVGVQSLIEIAKRIVNNRPRKTVVLLSFTAEESGAPGFSGWYWSWGSRFYVEGLMLADKMDRIHSVINVDAVFSYPFRISMNPCIYGLIKDLLTKYSIGDNRISIDIPYFDSFSFTQAGVPALTIHTLDELKVNYHTNLDDGKEVDQEVLTKLYELTYDIARRLGNAEGYDLEGYLLEYRNQVKEIELPLEARILENKLVQILYNKEKINVRKLVHILTKHLIKPVASHRIGGFLTAMFIPEVLILKQLEEIQKIVGHRESYMMREEYSTIHGVYVIGEEKILLPDLTSIVKSIDSRHLNQVLNSLRQYAVTSFRKINRFLDEAVKNVLL